MLLKLSKLPQRVIAIGLTLAVVVAIWIGRYIYINRAIDADEKTQMLFKKATDAGAPLLEALEKYRREHAHYPPDLSEFGPAAAGFLYSALPQDKIYKSADCEAREKREFEGFVMKSNAELKQMREAFTRDCITGYRNVALQSPSFAKGGDGALNGVERWAYYMTLTGRWAVGWCAPDYGRRNGGPTYFAFDGVCR